MRSPELAVGAFGEKLRKQREQRGLALDAISNTTKISTRMLRALEEEHFDQLPGGVFNKGFVRAYARQVGLDEEEAITDYLEALRESQAQSQKILPDFRNPANKNHSVLPGDSSHQILSVNNHRAGDGNHGGHHVSTAERRRQEDRRQEDRRIETRRNDDRPNKDRQIAATNLAEAGPQLVAGHPEALRLARLEAPAHIEGRGTAHSLDEHRNPTRSSDTTSMPGFITGTAADDFTDSSDELPPRLTLSTKRILGAALLFLAIGLLVWLSRRHQDPPPNSAAASNTSSSVPSLQSPTPAVASPSPSGTKIAPASSQTKTSVGKPSASAQSQLAKSPAPTPPESDSGADTPVAASSASVLTAKPPATFSLTIRADQTTWISITADGKPVAHETLIAPAHTSVRAVREIGVKVGNAAGVSFLLNGKEFPAEGTQGEVKTYLFDATGPKPAPTLSATPNP